MKGEVILELAGEGGSISLLSGTSLLGTQIFWMRVDDTGAYLMLDEDDSDDLGSPIEVSDPVGHFSEALKLLDKYPWYRLYPQTVVPEFREVILQGVRERGTAKDVKNWQELVGDLFKQGNATGVLNPTSTSFKEN